MLQQVAVMCVLSVVLMVFDIYVGFEYTRKVENFFVVIRYLLHTKLIKLLTKKDIPVVVHL